MGFQLLTLILTIFELASSVICYILYASKCKEYKICIENEKKEVHQLTIRDE